MRRFCRTGVSKLLLAGRRACSRLHFVRHRQPSSRLQLRSMATVAGGALRSLESSATTITAEGEISTGKVLWRDLRGIGVKASDLLMLSAPRGAMQYRILPRARCVLVILSTVRCVLTHDRLVALHTHSGRNAATLVHRMASVLRALRHSNQQGNDGGSMDGKERNSQPSGSSGTKGGSTEAPT